VAQSAVLERFTSAPQERNSRSGWSAVFALTLCVSTLIASEFMPVSILSPIASDLHLTQGAAGQAISISGLFAVLTSLSLATVTRGLDRRRLLLGLTLLMLVSGLTVALAPNYLLFMAGRAMIGVVIGGFWSMSAATVMRLVPEDQVPRALALLNGGNALATTIAAPLGSFLGQYIGWRGAFFLVVPLAAVTFAWQWLTLPAMPSDRAARGSSALGMLRRPAARFGAAAVAMLFAGQFALFTYVRPFLEGATQLSASALSLVLLMMGLGGLFGTWMFGRLVARFPAATLILAPVGLAIIASALVAAGSFAVPTATLLVLWGVIGTGAPVAWWTWVARRFPNDAEAGGGLLVAIVQLAITLGAAGGGLLFDAAGYQATFLASAVLLAAGALLAALDARVPDDVAAPQPS
jgi:predicted MFS family arabinose efflux permease